MKLNKKIIFRYLKYLYLFLSFVIPDLWLRIATKSIGQYAVYRGAPNVYTICWSLLICALVIVFNKRMVRRIIYALSYYFVIVYVIVQYGYYEIFGKFLFLSDLALAREGSHYISVVLNIIDIKLVSSLLIFLIIGIAGIILMPAYKKAGNKKIYVARALLVCACIFNIIRAKALFGEINGDWDDFVNPAYEYNNMLNSGYDVELMGIYQYCARDIYNNIYDAFTQEDVSGICEELDEYFQDEEEHAANSMTGIFEGKNVIIVQMESVDDWLVNEEDMPTVYNMMQNGIVFSNMYTPDYSSGYTFNTEFAVNVSVYPYSNGMIIYNLDNIYAESLENVFKANGYSVNSFHYNRGNYYNRMFMHEKFGFEKYHSYLDYPEESVEVEDDSFLYMSDELYNDVVADSPFMSYIITYSCHVPYDMDSLATTALTKHSQYSIDGADEEEIIRAKAHLTDDMFAGLLDRLEADGILEDTVIIGFGDHYAYGADDELLEKLSVEAGNSILENTPFFVYCAGSNIQQEVSKVSESIDIAPTIENLLGFDIPEEIMGKDIFDDTYSGYAIFPNNTWLTDTTYVKQGQIVWNNGMTDEEIKDMNNMVVQQYKINDEILDANYYSEITQ
jgi:phosphoglycerol transferase MdoB-like AlkP superfamily enzyme